MFAGREVRVIWDGDPDGGKRYRLSDFRLEDSVGRGVIQGDEGDPPMGPIHKSLVFHSNKEEVP